MAYLFLTPLVDAARLRLRDAFCLPLADDVPFKRGKRANQLQPTECVVGVACERETLGQDQQDLPTDATHQTHPRHAGTLYRTSQEAGGAQVNLDDTAEVRPTMGFREWLQKQYEKEAEEKKTGQ